MWLICTEDCSVCSFSSPKKLVVFGGLSFGLLFFIFIHIHIYFFFLPIAGWQSGTVLCAINFPTVSHSSPGPATLLDTIFDSIRLPNMRVGYLFPYNIHIHTLAGRLCGWRYSAARYRKCYFWLLFMRHDELTPQSRFSHRFSFQSRENNNNVGVAWMDGRMDRSIAGRMEKVSPDRSASHLWGWCKALSLNDGLIGEELFENGSWKSI